MAVLLLAMNATWYATTEAAVAKVARWTRSPLKDPQGLLLPPAVSYEVWVLEQGKPEVMVGSVPDTSYVLQAQPGVTYWLRVRGVSATGAKSAFSSYSNPLRLPDAAATGSDLAASCGPAQPNPFNARTIIAYLVPDGLPTGAVVELRVYDLRGLRVRGFVLDRAPGSHAVAWNGHDEAGRRVPAGLYLARYVCGAFQTSLKLTLVS